MINFVWLQGFSETGRETESFRDENPKNPAVNNFDDLLPKSL
jgi:hypothetical protein